MPTQLKEFIQQHEEWLMGRILKYAKQRGYTEYTSTLKEAWRLSISGLSKSMIDLLDTKGRNLELSPHEDYLNDPAAQFGIIEAERHRERGVSLDMFLGLMKYYRQTYSDLIRESNFKPDQKLQYEQIVKRFFDRVEIGFCTKWASAEDENVVTELQRSNREMTNEKNKYLTIFESLSVPVFIVDLDGAIENLNHAAAQMLHHDTAPGTQYYANTNGSTLFFAEEFPWLKAFFKNFAADDKIQESFETAVGSNNKYYFISFSRSLDVSGKFSNTIVIIEDITKRKILEKELEKFATTDPLTGAKNRRAFLNLFEKELKRAKRYNQQFALLMIDIDHFKKINDTFGHDTGDKVLKLLVAKSHSVLRDTDIFGRWGGEEFIVLLPETDLSKASSAAERLRGALAKSELVTNDGANINFTVSIGFTLIEDKASTMDEMIITADNALYQAKAQGRNQAVFLPQT